MADSEGMAAQGNQLRENGVTSERWKQAEALFEQALDAPAAARPEFLQTIADTGLRREVESLLQAHQAAGNFLDEPDRFFAIESLDTVSPGQIIERYRIIREIGRGGMGAVFLAERADDEYKKQVALKLIKRGTDTDAVLCHFRNERQILAGFDHPNIARLFDGGTTESGLPYFVMEYVEGLPIDDYCNTRRLFVVERLKLFREVCAAVSYAHRRLVIHRDIKCSNILVTTDGVPKLLDFGIAKLLQEDEAAQPTVTGLRLMTPQSASPEQLRGQPVTTASDVYSLGVVLYELLCGRTPHEFSSLSPPEMARAITENEPRKPSTVVARSRHSSQLEIRNSKMLKGDVDNIVLMALRKEPERRYQSVEQLSEDIRRHLEERPVLARSDTWSYRAAKFARRNKAGLAAAAIVVLILLGGIVATSREARIAKREKRRAERRFNDVRKLANSVLFDYHDAIKSLPGATKVRERLVKDALTYLDSLAGEVNGDPALQRELAAAYERLAEIRGGTASGSLGDKAGAVESHTKALKIRQALVALNPTDITALSDLARSHRDLGFRLKHDADASLEHLRKARAIYLDLTRREPANEDFQFDLANTCTQLGIALDDHDDPAGAIEQYRAASSICERLAANKPHEQRFRHALWSSFDNMARVLSTQNNPAGAIEACEKALALGEQLIKDDPLNADYRRGLALSYDHAGNYRSQSDPRGALNYYRRAAELADQLTGADPANILTRADAARAHKTLADALDALRENAEALRHFNKGVEICNALAADAPANLSWTLKAITCRAGAAGMQARLGEVDSALRECDNVTPLLREIPADKTNLARQVNKAEAYRYLAYAYLEVAESRKAAAGETQAISTARAMFQESLDLLNYVRSQTKLQASDEAWARTIAGEMAKCDAALLK